MTASTVPVSRWFRYWSPLLLLVVAIAIVLAFVGLEWWIQFGARGFGDEARREFGGDRVEALSAFVDSEKHTLAERNHAVWALGQLRDPRGLPVLIKHRTGKPCEHSRFLCQYEIEKAIALCRQEGARGWLARVLTLP
jgi:hypothetical protein